MCFVTDHDGYLPQASIPSTTGGGSQQWSKQLGDYLPQRGNSPTSPENAVFICPAARYAGYQTSNLSRTYTGSAIFLYFGSASASANGTTSTPRLYNSVERPSECILIAEGKQPSSGGASCTSVINWSAASKDLTQSTSSQTSTLDFRHSNAMNITYVDGHAVSLNFQEAATITRFMWEGRTTN